MPSFGFVGPTYRDLFRRVGVEECINLYPAPVPNAGSAKPAVLVGVPGLVSFADATSYGSSVRAEFYEDGRAFAVVGDAFLEISAAGVVTSRDTVNNDGRPATIVSNGAQGHQILIISGNEGWIFDTSANTLTAITDVDFPAVAATAVFIDGYFIVVNGSTGAIALSALYDGLSWDGTDVGLRSTVSDQVVSILKDHDELWLLGTKTLEPWRNTGATFPFEPIEGARVERGVMVPPTAINVNKGFAFLDAGGSVWYVEQSTPTQISTPAIDAMLASYDTLNDAEAYTYEWLGSVFYCLLLPTARTTLVYNFATNLWHEERSWNTSSGQWAAHLLRNHCWAFNTTHLVGDRSSGTIYRLSSSVYDFAGTPRRWLRRTPHIGDGLRRIFHDRLQLDMEAGVGLLSGQGSDPQVMLRYSNDWGATWSGERWAGIGARGNYGAQAEWWGLGSTTGARVYEVSGSDPVPVAIRDADLTFRAGAI